MSLPQRTFLVDVTVNGTPRQTETVMAPDALAAENTVRRRLNRADDVFTFTFDLVREVTLDWNSLNGTYSVPVVRVPDWYTRVITVQHR